MAMVEKVEILLNNEKVKHSIESPSSLKRHVWPSIQSCAGLNDSRVDILYQNKQAYEFNYILINLAVREKVKVTIRQMKSMLFFVINNGPGMRCEFGQMKSQRLPSSCFNLIHLPEFEISFYPDSNRYHYELFMMEIKDISSLLDAQKLKEHYSSFRPPNFN